LDFSYETGRGNARPSPSRLIILINEKACASINRGEGEEIKQGYKKALSTLNAVTLRA